MRYSDTTFVTGKGQHATIATAVTMANRDGPDELVFETRAGEIPVPAQDRTTNLTSVRHDPDPRRRTS